MVQDKIWIIFLNILWLYSFDTELSTCYSEINKARYCQPNFVNIVHNSIAISSSTCGTQGRTENVCKLFGSGTCFKCNNNVVNLSRSASVLVDHHVRGNETCWVSGKIEKSEMINVTLNLDRLYEAYYVTIEFCGNLPDSMILSKSSNNGKSWFPWHFFATSCQKSFGSQPTTASNMEHNLGTQILSPVCFSLTESMQAVNSEYKVVPFNPMIGRSGITQDTMVVNDWTSLTNLRISMFVDNSKRNMQDRVSRLGISDVTIGGREQCYGHASQSKESNNSMVCDCEHKTSGTKCEICLNTHNDQPWKAMLSSDSLPSECKKCLCNNHAMECEFDLQIHAKTKGLHGSRCINCSHQTSGPNCDSCTHGYYRNVAYPINHTKVCQKCKCHAIGAQANIDCDATSGRCHCKEGVDGPTCDRCKKGYHQTRSSIRPCAPDIQKKMMSTEEKCAPCSKQGPRIKFKKFCRNHIMIKISLQSKEMHGEWTRFGVRVDKIWREQSPLQSQVNLHESEYNTYPIWVENANVRCNCPHFELGITYILLTKTKQKMYLNQPELVVDRKSIVLIWKNSWIRRLSKFQEREKGGKCDKFKYKRRYSRQMFRNKGRLAD